MKVKTCLIVLGAKVDKECKPSPALRRRLVKCCELSKTYPCSLIILCGGITDHSLGKSEAEIMALNLIEEGVNKNRLLLEDKSKNTLENAVYAKKIMVQQGMQPSNIFVISDRYHLWRAKMIFTSVGMHVKGAAAPIGSDVMAYGLSCFREGLSLLKWSFKWSFGHHKKLMEKVL